MVNCQVIASTILSTTVLLRNSPQQDKFPVNSGVTFWAAAPQRDAHHRNLLVEWSLTRGWLEDPLRSRMLLVLSSDHPHPICSQKIVVVNLTERWEFKTIPPQIGVVSTYAYPINTIHAKKLRDCSSFPYQICKDWNNIWLDKLKVHPSDRVCAKKLRDWWSHSWDMALVVGGVEDGQCVTFDVTTFHIWKSLSTAHLLLSQLLWLSKVV